MWALISLHTVMITIYFFFFGGGGEASTPQISEIEPCCGFYARHHFSNNFSEML